VYLHSASGRLVGLRDDADDFVHASERIERRNGEFGRAEEENAQGARCYRVPVVEVVAVCSIVVVAVLVDGAVSLIVVVGAVASTGLVVFPSTPLLGSGDAPRIP
jgi:hypothetical protein